MNKKTRNLLVILSILVFCIAGYLLIVKFIDSDEQKNGDDTNTSSVFWDLSKDTIVELKLDNENGSFEFFYNIENGKWIYGSDSGYPLDDTAVTSLVSQLKALSYTRIIEEYTSLESYELHKPVVIITAKTADGESKELHFSSLSGADKMHYFKETSSDKVYITSNDLTGYSSYSITNFTKVVDVPPFSSYNITDISFGSLESGRIILEVNNEATEVNGETTVWDYHIEKKGENISETKTALVDDTDVMMNYINEFTLNTAVCINPDLSELKEYGIDYDNPSVTINFTGKTTKENVAEDGSTISETVDSEFTYKIYIGNATSDNRSQYYVAVSCIDAENDDSIYNSSSVYTTNAIYAEYYNEFDETMINGVNRIQKELLDEDDIPVLNNESIQSIMFSSNDNTILVDFSGEDSLYTVYDNNMLETDSGILANSAETQMIEYLSNSGLLSYDTRVLDYKNDSVLESYGLFSPVRSIKINFTADYKDNNGAITEYPVEWTLYIGNKTEEESGLSGYCVTADNTDNIYTMSESIIDYFLVIDKDILSGNKIYGKSSIDTVE